MSKLLKEADSELFHMVEEYAKLTDRTFLEACKFLQKPIGKQDTGKALDLFSSIMWYLGPGKTILMGL